MMRIEGSGCEEGELESGLCAKKMGEGDILFGGNKISV